MGWAEQVREEAMGPQPSIWDIIGGMVAPSGSPYGNEPPPFAGPINPFAGAEQGIPGSLYSVLSPPEEETITGPAEQWKQFVAAGGTQMKYKDGTTVKYNPPKSEAEKAQQKVVKGQVGQGGGQVAPPMAAPTPQPVAVAPQGPSPAEVAFNQQQVQAGQLYGRRYTPGEEPLSPQEEYQRRLDLIKREREERSRTLRNALPSRGELLQKGYTDVANRMGKGTRILLSIISMDPFMTDKMAAMGADFESERRRLMGTGQLADIDAAYKAEYSALDKLVARQTTERDDSARELESRLMASPQLRKNKDFARDFAITKLRIPASQVDTYLEAHYNKATGEYEMIKDPYSEKVITTRLGANALMEIDPSMDKDTAIRIALNPQVILSWTGSQIGKIDQQLMSTKDPKKKAELESERAHVELVQTQMTRDPNVIKLQRLIDQRNSPDWESTSPQTKLEWGQNYLAVRKLVRGPSPEQDPHRLWLQDRKDEVIIGLHIAEINRVAKEKEKPISHIKDQLIMNRDSNFASKKVTPQYQEQKRSEQMMLENMMVNPSTKWDKKEFKVMKPEADAYRNDVWNTLPATAKQKLGSLSYTESVQLANLIYNAQINGQVIPYEQAADMMLKLRRK
jgi:hypothetical protein